MDEKEHNRKIARLRYQREYQRSRRESRTAEQRAADNEYHASYAKRHPEKIRDYQNKYRAKHLDDIREYQREHHRIRYQETNVQKIIDFIKENQTLCGRELIVAIKKSMFSEEPE